MSSEFNPGKPGAGASLQNDSGAPGLGAPVVPPQSPSVTKTATADHAPATTAKNPSPAPPSGDAKPSATYKCPKCGTDARDVARFCPRCHTTLRFECPSCNNRQRVGGKCEQCGVDFIKYISAVVAAKKAEADAVHERIENRSALMKGLLWLPINGGFSLIKYFFKNDR